MGLGRKKSTAASRPAAKKERVAGLFAQTFNERNQQT
jgi:hypothetical protein